MFIFILVTMLRSPLQRLLGFEAPRNPVANSWGMPEEQK
jgi:hypothetical protein